MNASDLPEYMYNGCVAEVDTQTVFVADDELAFLFDKEQEELTILPLIPSERSDVRCGVVESPRGGKDIIVFGDLVEAIDIYNTKEGEWRRSDKTLPTMLQYTETVPFGDTFLAVGGFK